MNDKDKLKKAALAAKLKTYDDDGVLTVEFKVRKSNSGPAKPVMQSDGNGFVVDALSKDDEPGLVGQRFLPIPGKLLGRHITAMGASLKMNVDDVLDFARGLVSSGLLKSKYTTSASVRERLEEDNGARGRR